MGKLGTFFLGAIIGAGLVFGAQRYHVVRSDEGFYLVAKVSASFSDTYVDIRTFTLTDWANHKTLAAALLKSKKEHLMHDSAGDAFREDIRTAVNQLLSD
jgi:hypothetical protein